MRSAEPDVLTRLRVANPAPVQPDRGRSPIAKATLERILSEEATTAGRLRRRKRARISRGGAAVVLAVLVCAGGGAFAATDPFGWWSSTPDSARFLVNPAGQVRTPTAQTIGCHGSSTGRYVCSAGGAGQLYSQIDTIHLPGPSDAFTRAKFQEAIAQARSNHRVSIEQAARLRADLERVPDSFFAELRLSRRYQTYGAGNGRVPPPGVPEILVCEQTGSALSCQNLNGDQHAPIGSGVYMAQPAPDWRPTPARRQQQLLPPGIRFTKAEYRVLIDFASLDTSSGGTPSSAAPRQAPGPSKP